MSSSAEKPERAWSHLTAPRRAAIRVRANTPGEPGRYTEMKGE